MFHRIIKPMSVFLIFSFMLLDFNVQTAKAQMIGTPAVIAVQQQDAERARVVAFLGRDDVKQVMVRYGVDAVEAQKRVASLSDSEVANISKAMDEMPAGGDGIGTLVGAIVFIFLVLLLTDILGLTNVYPFVKHRR